MAILPFPRDDNGKPLYGFGSEIATLRYTSVDSSTGQAIAFTDDIKACLITCDQGALAWTFTGTNSNDADAAPVPFVGLTINVAVVAGTTIGTVKAASGTVDISVFGLR